MEEKGEFEEKGATGLLVEDRKWNDFWQGVILPERIQVAIPIPRKKIIILSGPTGVGKTEVSLIIAKAIGGEIISADSMQVYKGMDIGTAKVSKEDRKEVPHHLIDIRDIDESFNVIDFWYEAVEAIDQIHAKGRVPIVIGGTGFYINSLIEGPPSGPASVGNVRSKLEQEIEEKGALFLFERLERLDPEYAQSITHNDKQKIIRALEIITLTNRRVSEFSRKQPNPKKYDVRCWFLHKSKEVLYKRIEDRCDEMIKEGLVDEVKALEKKGLRDNLSASQAIGYRQCLNYLDSSQTEEDWSQFIASFKQASRRYAKRQFTWFRKEPLFRWLSKEENSSERAAEIILQDFETPF
jgi:tRNA dimethylallyltransferase